jgi:predicted  nucleic acid-binding Zn-ribbon protein
VEDKKDELDIDTVNIMGLGNAISQKQLADLHSQLQRLQLERLDLDRDFNLREAHLKSQIARLRDEKAVVEKQLYDTEYVVGEKDKEINKIKEEWMQERQTLKEEIAQLQDKVSFFR